MTYSACIHNNALDPLFGRDPNERYKQDGLCWFGDMRSSVARRPNGALIADTAIALALVGSATFFTIVMEYRVGHGELTRAEVSLLRSKVHVAHVAIPGAMPNKKLEIGTKESTHGQ